MNNIFFSIIIPVYNSEKYLGGFLDSVLAQKYEKFEVLLINDGSTDSSLKICHAYKQKDSRIHVFSKSNEGICKARNYGINVAANDYLVFYDNDDYVKPEYLEEAASVLAEKQFDIMTFSFLYTQLNKNGKPITTELCKNTITGVIEEDSIREMAFSDFGKTFNPVWNKIFRKQFIRDNTIAFDERFKKGMEDIFFNVKSFSTAKRIYCSNTIAYEYYIRDAQSTSRKFNPMLLQDSIRLFELIEEVFGRQTNNDNEMKVYVRQKFQYLIVAPIENEFNCINFKRKNIERIIENSYVKKFLKSINKQELDYLNKYQKIIFKCIRIKNYYILEKVLRIKMKARLNSRLFRLTKAVIK